MDMQDKIKDMDLEVKNKILNKITTISLVTLLFGVMILSLFGVPEIILNILSLLCSATFYTCFLFRYRFKFDKFHIGLVLMATVCIGLNIYNLNLQNEIISLITTMCVYGYYMYGQKLINGKVGKTLIIFCILIISSSILNILFTSKLVETFTLIVTLIVIIKIVNPVFENWGKKKRAKVEASGFTEEDAKKVPWIRKILFGRTGKLDLSILEMFKK